MGRVDNKVAIVTGGSAGIGRAASVMLAREGAKVAVVDINDKAGQETVTEIQASGGTALRVSSQRTLGWRVSVRLLALLAPFYGLVILIGYVVTAFSWGAFGEGLVVVASALSLIWTNTLLTSLYLEPTRRPHLGN